MPMKTVHCSLCGKPIKGRNFQERMAKLRRHRKRAHPTAHKRSVAKAMVTKGYDRKWRKRAGLLDPRKTYIMRECERCLKEVMTRRVKWEGKPHYLCEPCIRSIREFGTFDPLKVRKGLIKKPKVLEYRDFKADGLIRILSRQYDYFPEFALYPKTALSPSVLFDAGFKEESRDKWVLRTNKFNIFVYTV